jgi:hypothetical protein
MHSGWRASVALGFSVLVLAAGCKDRGSSGQDSRPLPTPEPPAEPSTVLPKVDPTAAPKKRAASEDAKDPNQPAVTAATKPEAAPSASGSVAAASSAAAGAGNAPAPTVSVPTPLTTIAPPSAACLSRCQGAMQGCLSQPVDGGVPGFGNLELCKKAFEACQQACAKQ